MSKSAVLAGLRIWSPGAWSVKADYEPQAFGNIQEQAAYTSVVSDMVADLYDKSSISNIANDLDNIIANSGALRIGLSPDIPAAQIAADPVNGVDAYILFDPGASIWSISQEGKLFEIAPEVVLAHEIGHTRGLIDPKRDVVTAADYYATDAFINAAQSLTDAGTATAGKYAYVPDVLSFEHAVSHDLGISDLRVSYDAGFLEGTAAYAEALANVDAGGSLTGGNHLDVVRIGNQHSSQTDNDMDFEALTGSPSVLALGLSGNDAIVAGTGHSYFFGGVGNDTLTGGAGNDRLYGGSGDDQIDGKGGFNLLFGGDGDDHILVRGSLDTVDGGAGNDVIKIFGPVAGQPAGSSLISFEDGRGIDVVEMQANALTVLDLSKYDLDDVTITAGGKDVYGGGFYQTFYTQFQFLTFTTPGGDRITFTDDLLTVGPSVPSDWSKTGTSYAASHIGPLSVQFADGNSLSQAGIWDYVRDFQTHSNVTLDLFGANGGRTYFNVGFSSMSGSAYLAHINSTYFVPDNIV